MDSPSKTFGYLHIKDVVRRVRRKLAKRGLNVALNGIDGAGKSTLARQLEEVMVENGIPVRYFHLYHWYDHLLKSPWLILGNRYLFRKLYIFDRTYLDNLAVFFSRRPRKWIIFVAAVVSAIYPKFDYAIFIKASFEETTLRRPGIDADSFEGLSRSYSTVMRHSSYIILNSDGKLVQSTLEALSGS